PAGTRPLRHGVGLPPKPPGLVRLDLERDGACFLLSGRDFSRMNPVQRLFERTAGPAGGLEVFQFRKQDWKLILGHRTGQTARVSAVVDLVQNWNGLPPEGWPAEEPVAQLVFNGRLA